MSRFNLVQSNVAWAIAPADRKFEIYFLSSLLILHLNLFYADNRITQKKFCKENYVLQIQVINIINKCINIENLPYYCKKPMQERFF